MAAAVVGQAFLSATLQTLLDRITSSELRDFMKNRKLNVSLLDDLKITLLTLDAVLNDAEEKQINDSAVKKWLEELKDAVFDAEDLLDEINIWSLRYKVQQDSTNTVRFIFSSFGESYSGMNYKLKEMSKRLKSFAEQKDTLCLQSVSLRAHKTTTTSLVNESIVVGREGDKEKLLNMLLCDEDASESDTEVIAIWGMGGLGKTTLAQLLYNDKKVQEHFDLKAWVCVSNDFNVFEITKNLLESVTSKVYDSQHLDFLRVELKNCLSNKKFLIVLDDLWNDKYSDWDDLVTPFRTGKRGSKIIVTTRQQRVVEITHTLPVHKLTPLSEENCWHLLAKHALRTTDPTRYPELEAIGRQIARKCGGLPIAARSIGGLLRSKVDAKEWNKILNSNIWDLPNDDVLPALHLSYLHLPSHLKKCFAYFSIFPKNHLLDKKQLALLWMAEGFLQQYSHGDKTMESKAYDFFDELLSRSFIQLHEADPQMFVMHDLVNDLAKVVSGKSCLRFEGNEIPKSVRHLSYPKQSFDGSKKFEGLYHLDCLRTLLSHCKVDKQSYFLTKKVSHDLLPKLKYLRVLSLSRYYNITELPNKIGNLEHLRYLDLSFTSITRLPDETFELYNLQTLLLSNCKCFKELPGKIEQLINLCHLDITGTSLEEMPTQISKLQNLQCLSTFMVGKQSNGLGIQELKKLPYLHGKLSILKLENVVDPMDAFEANLKRREKIDELVLEWEKDPEDSQMVKIVLDMLQPSINLQRLTISNYGGTSFPNWVGDFSFTKITFICMSNCKHCLSLPPFGQLPSLKKLLIQGTTSIQTIGSEFYCSQAAKSSSFQPFLSLEILKFENLSSWEEWMPFEGEDTKFPFPCLKNLYLHNCPILRGDMPKNLPSLRKVDILKCNLLEAKSSALQWITSIEKLNIEEREKNFVKALDEDSMDSLKRLRITKHDSLQSLPRMILGCHCLQKLYLTSIPSIESFPIDGLPTSLQRLEIRDCEKLQFLPQESWQNHTSLEYLKIRNSCHSLKSFPLGRFQKLKILEVEGCHNLETFTQVDGSAPTLKSFYVSNCKELRSMSEVQIDSLTTLEHFSLNQLPKLESMPQCGLPSNLQSFLIAHCKGLSSMAVEDWGFQRLTSLSEFHVEGDGSESILHNLLKNQLLPPSLVHLAIWNIYDLKLLDAKGLQHLTSLEELSIYCCQNLESLPEDKLPSSLLLLDISDCPKLKGRYDYQKGQHLAKIAHIPTVQINGEYYDPWEESQEGNWLSMRRSMYKSPTKNVTYQVREGEGSSKIPKLLKKKDLLEAKDRLKNMKGDQDEPLFW